MKLRQFSVFFLAAAIVIASCQKETSYEGGATSSSVGTLKASGVNCLPSNVNGVYKVGVALNNTNYIDVQVNVSQAGSYTINTDTVNGIFFRAIGIFSGTGTYSVRLAGVGTPGSSVGPHAMRVKYDSSSCFINVITIAANTPLADFNFDGSPNACTGMTVGGVYKAGTTLNASNTLTCTVSVASAGTYSVAVPTVNGMFFTGSGYFPTGGIQTVTLSGFGTPVQSGAFNLRVRDANDTLAFCSFSINVLPAGSNTNAIFTMGGQGSSCTGFTTSGTYTAGVPVNGTNTATVTVNVQQIGTYTIASNSVNGVTFVGTGTFTQTGSQPVILTAQNVLGQTSAGGTQTYTVTGGSSSCTMAITFGTGGGSNNAVYTFASGAGGTCTGATVAGTYTVGTPVTAANTATVSVNVTTAGTYSITTSSANGITFSGSGTFSATGTQNVVLTATGTPTAAGTPSFAISGSSTCTFTVAMVAGGSAATYTLAGAGGTCTGATVAGTYTAGTAVTSANTATVSVNVTAVGTYSINTTSVNGISFSGSGSFTTTGVQNVVLTATGTPTAAGTNSFLVTGASSTCSISVTTVAGTPQNIWKFTVGTTTYQGPTDDAVIDLSLGYPSLYVSGTNASNQLLDLYHDDENSTSTTVVAPGAYGSAATNGKVAWFQFTAPAFTYAAGPVVTGTNFVSTITTISTTLHYVEGTFSGTVMDLTGNIFTITNGTFRANFP